MDGWMGGWVDGWMDGWMDGRTDWQTDDDGWMDGWTDWQTDDDGWVVRLAPDKKKLHGIRFKLQAMCGRVSQTSHSTFQTSDRTEQKKLGLQTTKHGFKAIELYATVSNKT